MDANRLVRSGDAVTRVYASLADLVYGHADFTEILRSACLAAPELVDGCDHASVMLRRNGAYSTVASSDDIAAHIEALERQLQDGPCVDAITDEPIQLDADLTISIWPALAQRVLAETPVRGVAGFRLLIDNDKAGALNLFSDTPGLLTTESVHQGSILASFVSVAVAAAMEHREAATLRAGLVSNREIGRAVGLLMAFHRIGDAEAFNILRETSQNLNMRLPDVARQVLDHHEAGLAKAKVN